jgi:hypothetical protein
MILRLEILGFGCSLREMGMKTGNKLIVLSGKLKSYGSRGCRVPEATGVTPANRLARGVRVGDEAKCRVEFADRISEGEAHLESEELLFRGDFRLVIPFKNMKSVRASNGRLMVEFPEGRAVFHLGASAEKWASKITHPKSLMDKLSAKPGFRVSVLGVEERDFRKQLRDRGAKASDGELLKDSDLIFLEVEDKGGLKKLAALRKDMKKGCAVWVVFPKGTCRIRETDVIEVARQAGLVDIKVVKFSDTHTALKLVIPLVRR